MDELIFSREFGRIADLHSERRATIDLGNQGEFTFAQNRSRVTKLSDAMRGGLGLDTHDRFAVLLGNRHQYGELWHAGLCGAGVINPMNSRAHVDDIRYMLADSGAKVVFVDAGNAEAIERCRVDLPELRTVVRVGEGDFAGDLDYEDLLESGSDFGRSVDQREEDMAVLMYTGGTTGRPKGVVLTQRGVMLNWHRITESIRPTADWATLQVVPLFHVGAFVALTLTHLSGGAIAYLPRWDAKVVLDAIEKFKLTGLSAVPSMAVQLIEHPEFSPERVRSLRFFGYGAAPMSEGLLHRLLDVLPPETDFVQAYGLTEAGGMVTVLDGADHRLLDANLLRSVGRPMAGFDVSVRATGSGEPVPTGATGEIWLRSGSVMREYWNRPEDTADSLAEGWFHTGDVGYRDKRGYLWITDRAKDMIISGGENVFSLEVENAISTHPAVSEVAVIGRPHPLWGETVHAIVRLIDGHTATEEEITLHARSLLSGYKVPRSVEIRSEAFPQSPTGKIRKNELRDGISVAQAEPRNDGDAK